MKDIRSALRAILLGDSTISTAIDASRIYPGILPQGVTQQSIVYTIVGEDSDYNMQGSSHLARDRIQLDCWAQTVDAAVVLANLVKDELSGFRGTVSYGSNSPQDSVVIHAVFHDQGRDEYDSTAKLHARRRDYFIWYWDL